MRRFDSLLFLSVLSLAMMPAWTSRAGSSENKPTRDTPRELTGVWLRFHEADLCQGVDASFTFHEDGMDVRSLVEDERSYQRFLQMLEPLRGSYRIELHAVRPPEEEGSDDGNDPPPSLWENYKLRSYLGDPFSRARERLDSETPPQEDPSDGDPFLKLRLRLFAEQTLDWNKRMERYAAELPALTHVALDISAEREVRSRARVICRAHAQNMGKYIEKLENNLTQALPQSTGKGRLSEQPDQSAAIKASVESATRISAAAHAVASRIKNLIYPEQYTVDLDELRQSSLLQSLKALRRMNADFQKAVGKSFR